MEYQALYRKYRPKTFEEVYGQKIIVQTLQNIIKNNKQTHAYLFIGPRGTGKTSIAKIFAKTLNCENSKNGISCEECDVCKNSNNNENIDIIEMDAASNNGVDEIREIKNHVTLLPTMSKYKVYIIDEVHMLTTGAFNALLKTLEEPPKHVIFILATTEPHKIPLTIISRCQSFEFKPIPKSIIADRLKYICEKENIKCDDDALDLITIDSNGGMRDAIGLLDQLNAYTNGNIKYDDVLLLNGRISDEDIIEIFKSIKNNDLKNVFDIADKIEVEGKNFIYVCEDMIRILRNEMLDSENSKINLGNIDQITEIILAINKFLSDMKLSKDKRIFFDILMIKINNMINNVQTNVCNDIKIEKNKEKVKKEEPKKIEIKDYSIQEELMKIRINNILSKADKSNLENAKKCISGMGNEIINLDQLRILNILSEFEIKAASKEGIVMSTNIKNILEDMYEDILLADGMLTQLLGKETKLCVVLEDEWENIRNIYVTKIKNKEKIDYIDEKDIIKKIKNKVNDNDFDDLLEIEGE